MQTKGLPNNIFLKVFENQNYLNKGKEKPKNIKQKWSKLLLERCCLLLLIKDKQILDGTDKCPGGYTELDVNLNDGVPNLVNKATIVVFSNAI